MPAVFDISADLGWHVGHDFRLRVPFVDQDGNPVPITGQSFEFALRADPTSDLIYVGHTTEDGYLSIVDTNVLEIWIPAADTVGMRPDEYAYTVSRTDTGYRMLLMQGQAILQGSGRSVTPPSGQVQVDMGTVIRYPFTNAQVVALGAVADSSFVLDTLPDNIRVRNAWLLFTGSPGGVTTLKPYVGRMAAAYDDLITSDYSANANIIAAAVGRTFGMALDERGQRFQHAGINGGLADDSGAESTFDHVGGGSPRAVRLRLVATGGTLDAVTGCAGALYVEYDALPAP